MGVGTNIVGFIDLSEDSEFKKMIGVKKACEAANIPYPKELEEYFGCDPAESELYLQREKMHICIDDAVQEASDKDECEDVWIVDVSKLPKGCVHIRFTNSY